MAQNLEMKRTVHPHDLGVAARYEQAQERELGAAVVTPFHLHEMRQDMSLQVIDFDDRLGRGDGQTLGKRGPDQQRTQQAGSPRESNRIDIRQRHASLFQRLRHDRQDVLLVRPGRQFGDHTAIAPVDLLGGHHVGEEIFVAQHGGGSIVAGRFYTENKD